jgi:hypothetical protein
VDLRGCKGERAEFKKPVMDGHVVVPYPCKDIAGGTFCNIYRPSRLRLEMTMRYLACIDKDFDSARSATFGDFPGCSDDIADLPRMGQKAIGLHFERENLSTPESSAPKDWAGDGRFTGGCWISVNIGLFRIGLQSVRLNISASERLVGRIQARARKRRLSRSAFLALAAEREMPGYLPATGIGSRPCSRSKSWSAQPSGARAGSSTSGRCACR